MTRTEQGVGDVIYRTKDGIKYTPTSMMHKAIVHLDPTKLEMLSGFEQTSSGYMFVPEDSNARVAVSGRDWSEKRILIYGSKSSEEACQHVNTIIERVEEIGHNAELIRGPTISNIAVSGDLGEALQLEKMCPELAENGINVEYEPEQFPAGIVKLDMPAVTFLLFSTGTFVIQGLKSFNEIESAIERIQFVIEDI